MGDDTVDLEHLERVAQKFVNCRSPVSFSTRLGQERDTDLDGTSIRERWEE